MNLTPAAKRCNTCGMQISWDQLARERLNWRGPLNLDGSQHRHSSSQNTVIAAAADAAPTASQEQTFEDKPIDERRNAIQQAHEENMKSGEELRTSIDGLTTRIAGLADTLISIDKTMVILTETIKAYLDLPK